MGHQYLQCAARLEAASESTALTSPLDQSAWPGCFQMMTKIAVHDSSKLVFQQRGQITHIIQRLTSIYLSIGILWYFIHVCVLYDVPP